MSFTPRHERRHERHEFYDDRWKRRGGALLTTAAYRSLACKRNAVIGRSVIYWTCGSTWYRRINVEGELMYVVVERPTDE